MHFLTDRDKPDRKTVGKQPDNKAEKIITQKSLEQKLIRVSGKDRIEILFDLMNLLKSSNSIKAVEYGTEGLDLLKDFPDRNFESGFLKDLSWIYQRTGKYQESLELCFRRHKYQH